MGDASVRLIETTAKDQGEWIALSHKWGPETSKHFCTTVGNLEEHKRGIPLSSLPATFRDAVFVTRAIPVCRYLWIDSICIVQGPGGDFNVEAKNMTDVYSGAYCVLAASRADHQDHGFLKELTPRDCVALPGRPVGSRPGQRANGEEKLPPFYICENIDDFDAHVLQGSLNRRGWVLQEHALARRTVFFTEKQMYFECGEGTRCQTMTTMKKLVALSCLSCLSVFLCSIFFSSHPAQAQPHFTRTRASLLPDNYLTALTFLSATLPPFSETQTSRKSSAERTKGPKSSTTKTCSSSTPVSSSPTRLIAPSPSTVYKAAFSTRFAPVVNLASLTRAPRERGCSDAVCSGKTEAARHPLGASHSHPLTQCRKCRAGHGWRILEL